MGLGDEEGEQTMEDGNALDGWMDSARSRSTIHRICIVLPTSKGVMKRDDGGEDRGSNTCMRRCNEYSGRRYGQFGAKLSKIIRFSWGHVLGMQVYQGRLSRIFTRRANNLLSLVHFS